MREASSEEQVVLQNRSSFSEIPTEGREKQQDGVESLN